jgi:hypothetical protein
MDRLLCGAVGRSLRRRTPRDRPAVEPGRFRSTVPVGLRVYGPSHSGVWRDVNRSKNTEVASAMPATVRVTPEKTLALWSFSDGPST